MDDPIFGCLTYNEKLGWWEGKLEISASRPVIVYITAGNNELPKTMAEARSLFGRVKKDEDEIKNHIAKSMIDLANNWRAEEDEKEIDEDLFIKNISLESMAICPGNKNAVTLYYSDGDMFAGHTIAVELDDKLNLNNAKIA